MKLEKLFLPLSVLAAVIAVYVFFRGTGSNPQTLTTPSAAPSGVTAPLSAGGLVTPITYSVATQPVSVPPVVVMSDPFSANPGGTTIPTPPYLSYNLGSGNLAQPSPITQTPATDSCCGSCGQAASTCGNICGKKNSYVDGNGNVALNTTRKQQLAKSNPSTWQPKALSNLDAYLATENNEGGPSLASWMPSGMIQ